MSINESRTDRIIRVVVGVILGLLALFHVGRTVGTWILGIVAAIALITGLTGRCGVYRLFGIRTCPGPTSTPPAQP